MKCIDGRIGSFIDIRFLEAGDRRDLFSGTRIEDIKCLPVRCLNPATADKGLVQWCCEKLRNRRSEFCSCSLDRRRRHQKTPFGVDGK